MYAAHCNLRETTHAPQLNQWDQRPRLMQVLCGPCFDVTFYIQGIVVPWPRRTSAPVPLPWCWAQCKLPTGVSECYNQAGRRAQGRLVARRGFGAVASAATAVTALICTRLNTQAGAGAQPSLPDADQAC